MSKGTKSIKDMTDEEIKNEVLFYTNIEFTIKSFKFILKNVDIEYLKNYDNVGIIKLFLVKIDWYQVLVYDKVFILDSCFILTERTKSKIVLVKESGQGYIPT